MRLEQICCHVIEAGYLLTVEARLYLPLGILAVLDCCASDTRLRLDRLSDDAPPLCLSTPLCRLSLQLGHARLAGNQSLLPLAQAMLAGCYLNKRWQGRHAGRTRPWSARTSLEPKCQRIIKRNRRLPNLLRRVVKQKR